MIVLTMSGGASSSCSIRIRSSSNCRRRRRRGGVLVLVLALVLVLVLVLIFVLVQVLVLVGRGRGGGEVTVGLGVSFQEVRDPKPQTVWDPPSLSGVSSGPKGSQKRQRLHRGPGAQAKAPTLLEKPWSQLAGVCLLV